MKILLAIDGTKYGDAAAEMLQKLRIGNGDRIKIVCVVDMAIPLAVDAYGGYLPDTSETEKAARENADKIVETTSAKILTGLTATTIEGNVAIETDILFGSPESRIVETAEEMNADLIVLGSHGYKSWERLLLGSVSHSVVHHAPCSVLVVRTSAGE